MSILFRYNEKLFSSPDKLGFNERNEYIVCLITKRLHTMKRMKIYFFVAALFVFNLKIVFC